MENNDQSFRLKAVSARYSITESGSEPDDGARYDAIQEIDLQIGPGEWIGIAGKNGSGKSTLGTVLAGRFPLSSGEVQQGWIQDGKIGMVMQNPETQIVGETVYEDVCFGLEYAEVDPLKMPEIVTRVLERIGLTGLVDAPISTLSGGQKQLVAIAGCLAVNTRLIIFDEATSMLDPLARQRILDTAEALRLEGVSIVWITQRMEELSFCGRVYALDQGRLVFSGSPRDFFYGEAVGTAYSSDPLPAAEFRSFDKQRLDDALSKPTPCDQLGFPAPYAVRLARELLRRGVPLPMLPLTPVEVGAAVPSRTCSTKNFVHSEEIS